MKLLVFLLGPSLAFMIGCAAPPPTGAPSTDVPDSSITIEGKGEVPERLIPAGYKENWFLPSIDRWETYWQEQYKADSTGDLRMRHADLDGDGMIDHALFLCRADTTRRDTAYAVVVSFGNGKDTLLEAYP